jgi:hypothetical protein
MYTHTSHKSVVRKAKDICALFPGKGRTFLVNVPDAFHPPKGSKNEDRGLIYNLCLLPFF